MAQKPYKTQTIKKQQVEEPLAAYGRADTRKGKIESDIFVSASIYSVHHDERASILRAKEQYAQGEYFTQEEMDKMVMEWLS